MSITKKLLSVFLICVLVFTAVPVSVFAQEPQDAKDLLLATVSDIHYYPETLAQFKGEAFYTYIKGSNCVYENLNSILDSTFDALAKDAVEKGLRYLVVCGDLTTNGEYDGHMALAEKFRAFENETGIRVFVINGNHDINNPDAAAFTEPDGRRHPARRTSPVDFYNIYREFGFDDAVSTFSAPDTGKAGALSYAVELDGYRLIMIDAGKYTADNTYKGLDIKETGGNVTPEVLEWIQGQAEEAKKNHETPIAFTHWNASEMSYLHGEVLQGFVIDNAYKLQETLADMGIHYIFSGHQHVTDLDVTYSDAGEPLYSVITPTLTQFPFAFRESAFSTDAEGNVTADFQQYDCDVTKIITSEKGVRYLAPYRESGFALQFGNGSPAEYLLWMIKGLLSGYIDQIRDAGSIITFLKDQFDFDVKEKIDDILRGGFTVEDINLFTTDNVMSFLADLDQQIMNTYINDTDRLWNAISESLVGFMSVKVSEIPCTKFLYTYGFGDASAPGTLGDVLFSSLVYMYCGNENASDDLFMQDVLAKMKQPAFVDFLIENAEKYIVEDLLVDEILGHLYVHVNALFSGNFPSMASFLQFAYQLITGVIAADIFNAESSFDFARKLLDLATYLTYNQSSTTYKYLIEYILSKNLVKYGSTVKEVVCGLLDQYLTANDKEATAYQIWVIIGSILEDSDRDWNVSYNYTGPVPVLPTMEDMQLPTDINVKLEKDKLILHWLTKYSVTGSDIEIHEKESGQAVPAAQIEKTNEKDTYTGYGFSFGSFGILPWSRDITGHTVTVSGLQPGKTYVYRIGDAEKEFWTESAEIAIPAADAEKLTFLYMSNIAAPTPDGYSHFSNALSTAKENYPDAKFTVLSGSSVLNGKDDSQFSAALNRASDLLLNTPLYYVAGKDDIGTTTNLKKHFNLVSPDPYNDDAKGVCYSFDEGYAHFVVLNTNDLKQDGTLSQAQLMWFREDMQKTRQKWKIVMTDAAVISGETENTALRQQILKLADDLLVDLLIEGSAGAYYHSRMIRNSEFRTNTDSFIREVDGVKYLAQKRIGTVAVGGGTAGGSYAEAVENDALYSKVYTQNAPMYLAVTVYENDLVVNACVAGEPGSDNGIESFVITKFSQTLRLGDIDMDGRLSAADARIALRYAVGLQTLVPEQKLAADVNLSRSVTAADARLILRAVVGLQQMEPETVSYYEDDLLKIDY